MVIATGNARSTSVGLRNVYTFRWSNAELGWESSWLRAASRNSNLALKASYRVLFRNLPALEALVLRSPAGLAIGTVDVLKNQVDTNLTTSLVIAF